MMLFSLKRLTLIYVSTYLINFRKRRIKANRLLIRQNNYVSTYLINSLGRLNRLLNRLKVNNRMCVSTYFIRVL